MVKLLPSGSACAARIEAAAVLVTKWRDHIGNTATCRQASAGKARQRRLVVNIGGSARRGVTVVAGGVAGVWRRAVGVVA